MFAMSYEAVKQYHGCINEPVLLGRSIKESKNEKWKNKININNAVAVVMFFHRLNFQKRSFFDKLIL